jgi:hypothetical protein
MILTLSNTAIMKRYILFALLAGYSSSLRAQLRIPAGTGPVKFDAIVMAHSGQGSTDNNLLQTLPNGAHEQGEGSAFDQWAWYWRQHLDKDGYMVPPSRTLTAWQGYMQLQGRTHAKTTAFTPSNWVFQGPASSVGGYAGMGRINVVAFDPIDSNIIYAGSAAGSTWKTTDGGLTWASLYDFLPTLGVSDIKINPLNRNSIYVATGDAEAGDSYSSGVILSHDGGATWLTTGLTWLPTAYDYVRSLLINPQDTNSMMLATNVGIYKSYDAGATWANVAAGDFKQILYKPGDSSMVYGTMYAGGSAQIMRSANGGLTWSAVTTFTDAQRINIAVCPASPAVVKAVASNFSSGLKGIYSSTNSGASYTEVYTNDVSCSQELLGYDLGLPTSSCGGKGWYALCIAIDPANAANVTIGAINTYYSADGGASWNIANGWYDGLTGLPTVHANKHCLAYSPTSGALFEACDGGLYKNYGPLTAPWTDLSNGICVTQFYRNAVDNNVAYCLAGSQDNGTKKISGGTATDVMGGNGTQPLINYGDPVNIFYCSAQYGYITMTRDAGAHFHSITDVLMSQGGFLTPYALNPTDTATLYLGYKNVFVSHNNGDNWAALSPVFDTGAYINRLVVSPANPAYIYIVQDEAHLSRSVIYFTANAGVSWDSIHVPFTNLISDIAADTKNEQQFWVTVSGYGPDKVYKYNGITGVWTNESGTLPDLPVDCMVIDSSTHTRYIGTDAAVFYRDTVMTDWALYNIHLPTAHVYDLKINYATNEVWAATFGRGIWKSNRALDLGPLLVGQVPGAAISISPNPGKGAFAIHTASGQLMSGVVRIKLMTADGKTVMATTAFFDGNGNLKVSAIGLAAGLYVCELSSKQTTTYVKVVVE